MSLHSKPRIQGVCVFSCNLPKAPFRENDLNLLRVTAVTRVWNGYRNNIQHRKLTLRKKFSRRACKNSNPRPFNHESGALTTELSPLPVLWSGIGYPAIPSCRRGKSLNPFLTGRMFLRPHILRTLRRTMIRFLIELLVRRIWFGQSKLYFILNWLIMRFKLRPELAADAQQTA